MSLAWARDRLAVQSTHIWSFSYLRNVTSAGQMAGLFLFPRQRNAPSPVISATTDRNRLFDGGDTQLEQLGFAGEPSASFFGRAPATVVSGDEEFRGCRF